MKSIEEVRDYIIEHRTDEDGDIDLRELDFSNFDGDVYTSYMKVKKDLVQEEQRVDGNLRQSFQNVGKNLSQSRQKVKGALWLQDTKGLERTDENNNIYEKRTYVFDGRRMTKEEILKELGE